MKKVFSYIIVLILVIVSAISCNKKHENHDDHKGHGKEESKNSTKEDHDHEHEHEHGDEHGEEHKHEHDEHDHKESNKNHAHDEKTDNHEAHTDHGDHDDHDNEEAGHDHGSSKAVGEGKAIEVVDEKNGFKLHENAKKLMNLTSVGIKEIPTKAITNALVYTKDEVGVYRVRQSFYKFIVLKKESNGEYLLTKQNFEAGDQLVTGGLDLLRISDVYSQDKSEYGHSH